MNNWQEAQIAETEWWGDCRTTLVEDLKQIEFAPLMGLEVNKWMQIDLRGTSVCDLGGGPASLLLKCQNIGAGSAVIDPAAYPNWTIGRYATVGIEVIRWPVEELPLDVRPFDEAWCYNVLQHVIDPEKFVSVAQRLAPVLRLMEWCHQPVDQWHPHTLTPEVLEKWIGQPGTVTEHKTFLGHSGIAFHGVFRQ